MNLRCEILAKNSGLEWADSSRNGTIVVTTMGVGNCDEKLRVVTLLIIGYV